MGRFTAHASNACFTVPAELVQDAEPAGSLPSRCYTEETALEAKLVQLRQRIAVARAVKARCESEANAIKEEASNHAEVVDDLMKAPAALGKENARCAEVAAALVATAKQLQPLLEQAEKLQRSGNFLNERSEGTDPLVVASSVTRKHFIRGASLDVLRAINQQLAASAQQQ